MIYIGRTENGNWFVEGWTPWKKIRMVAPELADAFRKFGDETEVSKIKILTGDR